MPKLFIFLFFCIFHENRRILTIFHRRYELSMQKYPNKHIFIEFAGKTITSNFVKLEVIAIKLIFSQIWKFLIWVYLSSFPSKKTYFLTFSDSLLKSFSENLKKLTEITKIIHFLFFCIFHENRRILNCFHRRYEFSMQKYPNKNIFLEFAGKTRNLQFYQIGGRLIAIKLIFSKIWKFLNWVYLSAFPSKKHIFWLFLIFCSRVSVKISKN